MAIAAPDDAAGRVARLVLIMTSCATVGRLLAGATPLTLLKIGVVAMAVVDSVFIFGGFFHEQNATFNAAAPAEWLPRLQVAEIGLTSTDYGDFCRGGGGGDPCGRPPAAADRRRAHLRGCGAVEPAFPCYGFAPDTVPPAAVLVGFELWSRRQSPLR